uniref:hypothetical protein n=1 Tax=uncultured Acinetobacter sp. TaxID=165433 RepID=UPI0026032531|nr:hypothetical protein [uncultured Acinetobacter sp.]
MLMHAGIDFATAEKMPMHYALAFLSERQALMQIGTPKPVYERQHNTYTPQQPVQPKGRATTSTNTYNSTKRVCS